MGDLKTIVWSLAAVVGAATPAAADEPLAEVFGRCAGVYAAALEHAWLVGDPRGDVMEEERAEIVAILDAVSGGVPRPRASALRVEARAAHRALLADAAFGSDPDRASWSAERAERQLVACRGLLLKG